MNTAEQIILLILAVTLATFLILSIIIAIKTIQILKHIKLIIEKAENIADKAEAVSEFFQNTAGPVAIVRLISNIFHVNNEGKKSKGRSDNE